MSPDSNTGSRRWLRLAEAAETLGVSHNTLRRWSDAGVLRCYRTSGGHRRYRRSDLERFLLDSGPTVDAAPILNTPRRSKTGHS